MAMDSAVRLNTPIRVYVERKNHLSQIGEVSLDETNSGTWSIYYTRPGVYELQVYHCDPEPMSFINPNSLLRKAVQFEQYRFRIEYQQLVTDLKMYSMLVKNEEHLQYLPNFTFVGDYAEQPFNVYWDQPYYDTKW